MSRYCLRASPCVFPMGLGTISQHSRKRERIFPIRITIVVWLKELDNHRLASSRAGKSTSTPPHTRRTANCLHHSPLALFLRHLASLTGSCRRRLCGLHNYFRRGWCARCRQVLPEQRHGAAGKCSCGRGVGFREGRCLAPAALKRHE